MVFNGIGAGINELTSLAATSEIAPTRKRGLYVSCLIFTIIPFVPSVLYAQLIAYYSTWRYIGVICCVWCAIGTLLTFLFYFPPPRNNSRGLSRAEVIREIDWLGAFLSILGITLFIMGLQFGGYQVVSTPGNTVIQLLTSPVPLELWTCTRYLNSRSNSYNGLRFLADVSPKCISHVSERTTTKYVMSQHVYEVLA